MREFHYAALREIPTTQTLELMKYSDGSEAHVGDVVVIDGKHKGTVVASIDTNEYTAEHPKEQWAYLGRGVMIDTDFGGLVHYSDTSQEHIVLKQRRA